MVLTVPVLIGVTVITFAVAHAVPGDPARAIAGMYADQQTVDAIRRQWGLDRPLPVQYLEYLKHLVHGDLGQSITTRDNVLGDILHRLPATLELAFFALFVMCVFGILLGIAAAVWRNRSPDHVARLIVVLGAAMPSFFLGLLLQLLFFRYLNWLPATGRLDEFAQAPTHITGLYLVDSVLTLNGSAFVDALKHIVLPGVTLALLGLAGITRMTRATMSEVLQQDYIRAARARGIGFHSLIFRHALKNSLIPTVTVIGLLFGSMIGGAVVIEWIFAWPGIGSYAADAVTSLDYNAIMGAGLAIAVVYVIANLLVDVSYMVLNPQIRER
ncbi:MAG: ABC transporter permease [Mycolicibacterium hassiacum]|nr:ABC transporter permease [Mycolicibacterium hassiacum]